MQFSVTHRKPKPGMCWTKKIKKRALESAPTVGKTVRGRPGTYNKQCLLPNLIAESYRHRSTRMLISSSLYVLLILACAWSCVRIGMYVTSRMCAAADWKFSLMYCSGRRYSKQPTDGQDTWIIVSDKMITWMGLITVIIVQTTAVVKHNHKKGIKQKCDNMIIKLIIYLKLIIWYCRIGCCYICYNN